MKVFMLGWEFPPFISGGLGTACHGLTKALSNLGVKISFVLPKPIGPETPTHVQMLTPEHCRSARTVTGTTEKTSELVNVRFQAISTPLQPYMTPQEYQKRLEEIVRQKQLLSTQSQQMFEQWLEQEIEGLAIGPGQYSGDMYTEVHRYAAAAVHLALQQDFDVVHAHDWMTFPAGIAVSAVTGKPLIVHVHSTEFDRSGEHVNQMIYDIERRGLHAAAKVIAVSYLTRNILMTRYGVSGDKIEVIYNAVDPEDNDDRISGQQVGIRSDEKIVLFLGRITMQKGPEYFLMAARKVLEEMENVKFVMAGTGDMMHRIIEMAAHMGIGHKVLFTGFLRGEDVKRVYRMADLYVMPSVSEPFGIAPLEALNHDVPVIISKQSGVAEVLTHVLKVDFWDVQEMANKIIAVLKYPPLHMTLREHGNFEVRKLKWSGAAKKCLKVYQEVTRAAV